VAVKVTDAVDILDKVGVGGGVIVTVGVRVEETDAVDVFDSVSVIVVVLALFEDTSAMRITTSRAVIGPRLLSAKPAALLIFYSLGPKYL
jgi:hypothetical protein